MKLIIALITAAGVGGFLLGFHAFLNEARRPSPDFATRLLKRWGEKLLVHSPVWLTRYLRHVTPILNEVPLSPPISLPLFLGLHAVAGISLWLVVAVAFPSATWELGPLCFGGGMIAPYVWLKHKQSSFHTALLRALPEYLEVQALILEAGLDFNAGVQHYLEKGAPNPFQTLLAGFQKEMHLGRSRQQALMGLAQRTTFVPLKECCRGIAQALSLGGSLAPFLRDQATALRTKRMQIAEKKAAEAPLKILFPLFVFIFPTIFIVLLGPMALLIVKGGF